MAYQIAIVRSARNFGRYCEWKSYIERNYTIYEFHIAFKGSTNIGMLDECKAKPDEKHCQTTARRGQDTSNQ